MKDFQVLTQETGEIVLVAPALQKENTILQERTSREHLSETEGE